VKIKSVKKLILIMLTMISLLGLSLTVVNFFSKLDYVKKYEEMFVSASFDAPLNADSEEYKQNNSFFIFNKTQFINFAKSVQNGCLFEGKAVSLMYNINLNGETLAPISQNLDGGTARAFQGIFDGGGKTVSNVSIKGAGDIGLFGAVNGAKWYSSTLNSYYYPGIYNLHVENIDIKITRNDMTIPNIPATSAGGLCGSIGGDAIIKNVQIDNVSISTDSSLAGKEVLSELKVGGVVGSCLLGLKNTSDQTQSGIIDTNVKIENCNLNGFKFYSGVLTDFWTQAAGPSGYFSIAEFGPCYVFPDDNDEYDVNITLSRCNYTMHHRDISGCGIGCIKGNHWLIEGTISKDKYNVPQDIPMSSLFKNIGVADSKVIWGEDANVHHTYTTSYDGSYYPYYFSPNFNFGTPILMQWLTAKYYYYSADSNGTLSLDTDNFDAQFDEDDIDEDGNVEEILYYSIYLPSDDTSKRPDYTKLGGNDEEKWIAQFTISPVPNEGYKFKEWIEDTTTVSGKTIYVATFEEDPNADDGGGGDDGDDSGDDDGGDDIVEGNIELYVYLDYGASSIFQKFYVANGCEVNIDILNIAGQGKEFLLGLEINNNIKSLNGSNYQRIPIHEDSEKGIRYRYEGYSISFSGEAGFYHKGTTTGKSFTMSKNTTIRISYTIDSSKLTFKFVENSQLYNTSGSLMNEDFVTWITFNGISLNTTYVAKNPEYSNRPTLLCSWGSRTVVYVINIGYKLKSCKMVGSNYTTFPINISIVHKAAVIEPVLELAQCTVTIAGLGDYADMATLTISTPGEEDVSTTEPFVVEMGTIINFTSNRIDGIFTYTYVFVYNEETIKTITYEMKDALYAMQFELDESGARVKLLNSLEGEYPSETFTIDGITTLTISPTFGLRQYFGGLG